MRIAGQEYKTYHEWLQHGFVPYTGAYKDATACLMKDGAKISIYNEEQVRPISIEALSANGWQFTEIEPEPQPEPTAGWPSI